MFDNVVPFPRPEEDERFARKRRPPQTPDGQPFLQKWRRDLPPFINRFFDAASRFGVIRFERAPVFVGPTAEDLSRVKQLGRWTWQVFRDAHAKVSDGATDFCSCDGKGKHRFSRRGHCKVCGKIKPAKDSAPVTVRYNGKIWTCGCKGSDKTKAKDCKHIKLAKLKAGIGGSYAKARRRLQPRMIYPRGELTDYTRQKRALDAMLDRIAEIIYWLCLRLPDRERNIKGGATGVQDRVIVFAVVMRSFFGSNFANTRSWMRLAPMMYDLGHTKKDPPSRGTISERLADARFYGYICFLMLECARWFRRIDQRFLGDSAEYATIMVANSRDRKASVKPATFRADTPMIRVHFAVGHPSGAIYAAQASLNRGKGSGDSPHYPDLARTAVQSGAEFETACFDRGYPSKRNYAVSEELGLDLHIREKLNEDKLNGRWPSSAERIARLERAGDPATEDEMMVRSMAENVPSVDKRRKSWIKNRKRVSDPAIDLSSAIADDDDDAAGERARELIDLALEEAELGVGFSRLAEVYADLLIHSACRAVVWEYRFGVNIDFEDPDFAFPRIITVKETGLVDEAAAEELLREIELRYGGMHTFEFDESEMPNIDPS